ncbi:MAG: hypothetical protein RI897_1591 [Verrucomicrobiota bacterium]|jgi:soluble cytochrome b562
MICSFRSLILVVLVLGVAPLHLRAETPLGKQMDTMKGALRPLKAALRSPTDADKAVYTGYADKLIAAATKAKDFQPEKTATLPEADRAQFLADYQKSLDGLIAMLKQLKSQLAAGDWDAARAQMRKIFDAQADGHDKFRVEEF